VKPFLAQLSAISLWLATQLLLRVSAIGKCRCDEWLGDWEKGKNNTREKFKSLMKWSGKGI